MQVDDPPVDGEVVVHHALRVEALLDRRADTLPVQAARGSDRGNRVGERADEEAVLAVADDLGHRAARVCDHRRAARHRLDDAEAERLVEADQVQERTRAAEQRCALAGLYRTDVADPVTVDPRRDELARSTPRPGRSRRSSAACPPAPPRRSPRRCPSRGGSCRRRAGSRRRPAPNWNCVHVDAVVDRGDVVECLVPVGVADRDVVARRGRTSRRRARSAATRSRGWS